MVALKCGRCFEPTPATTVERISFGDSSYKIPLCDEHANRMQREIFGWTRCGEIVENTPVPARRPEPVAPQRWTHVTLPPAVPTQPAARVTRRGRMPLPPAFAPMFEPHVVEPERVVVARAPQTGELDLPDRRFKVEIPKLAPAAFANPFAAPEPEKPADEPEPEPEGSLDTAFTRHRAAPQPGRPLPDDWQQWHFSEHATERRRERRVSPAEVLWAACHPDIVRPGNTPDTAIHIREHVHVVLNPTNHVILTVANRRLNTQEGTYANVAS